MGLPHSYWLKFINLMKNTFLFLYVFLTVIFNIKAFTVTDSDAQLIQAYFGNAKNVMPRISPDGKYLARLTPWRNNYNIFITNLETRQTKQITFETCQNIFSYVWINSGQIIYKKDFYGDKKYHLILADIKTCRNIDLTPFAYITCSIIEPRQDSEGKILIQMNKENNRCYDVYKLQINTGRLQLIEKNPGSITHWISDHNGKIRLAIANNNLKKEFLYREKKTGAWQKIASYDFDETVEPICFTFDNKNIYVLSNLNSDTLGFYEYNLKKGQIEKCIFQHFEADANDLLFSHKRKILGACYILDKLEYFFFDPEFAKICQFVQEKLPDYQVHLISKNIAEDKLIFLASSDVWPGSYYLLDTNKQKLEKLFDCKPTLQKEKFCHTRPISYTARDGLKIHGYLTMPKKHSEPRPLIVIPHGGPYSRDVLQFSSETQFFARKGFAVLRVNFRGSFGYGKKFYRASFKEWGHAMIDDITDGVLWTVRNKDIDSNNIVIYGNSYGGYAALMGAIKTPDLYKAAINCFGISNLFSFLEYYSHSLQFNKIKKTVGDTIIDKQRLVEASPLLNLNKIKIPIFIAYSENDFIVPKKESQQLILNFQDRNIPIESFYRNNEGHGFNQEENKFDLYKKILEFLAKHLKSNL